MYISGNHLTNYTNRDVEKIGSANQAIKFLPQGFSDFFPNLIELTLLQIPLDSIQRSDFKDLTKMKVISFAFVQLSFLPKDLLRDLRMLAFFEISSAELFYIPEGFFANQPNLKVVNFEANKLTSLCSSSFSNSHQLKKVMLSENRLHSISPDLLERFEAIETVDLEDNPCFLGSKDCLKDCETFFQSHDKYTKQEKSCKLILERSLEKIQKLKAQTRLC